MGSKITLTAADGKSIGGYRADPASAPRGALIVCQEIFGVNHHIRNVCDRYAEQGYVAIAPAFFDRVEPGIEYGYTPDDITKGVAVRAKLNMADSVKDIEAAVKMAQSVGKVGIVGYCYGGTLAWKAATSVPGLSCAIAYYGGGIAELVDEQPRCPVIMHFGETDHGIPLKDVDKIKAAHPTVPVYVYAGAGHGFSCDERGSFDAACAKLALERTLVFLKENVG